MYRLYIDETGNADLGASRDPNHRYLSLTGTILDIDHTRAVATPRMIAIKDRFLGQDADDPIIFHRKDILNRTGPFRALKDDALASQFDAAILQYLTECQYTAITALIDKMEHLTKYRVWRHEPYHYCLEIMIERYVQFLRRKRARGDVMGEVRGGKMDRRLERCFAHFYKHGTSYVRADAVQRHLTSGKLKLRPKTANITGLQISDLLAHPSALYIRSLIDPSIKLGNFGGQVADLLVTKKYDRKWDGTVPGWGVKWLP